MLTPSRFFIFVLLVITARAEQQQVEKKPLLAEEIEKRLAESELKTRILLQKREHARLNYHKNMLPELYDELVAADVAAFDQLRKAANDAKGYLKDATDPALIRRLSITATLDLDFGWNVWRDKKRYFALKALLLSNYTTSYACDTDYCKQRITLFPDLVDTMPAVEDYGLLTKLWHSWSTELKNTNDDAFRKLAALANDYSEENYYYGYWEKLYERRDLTRDAEKLWTKVLPLYEELHAYVRGKLIKKYKNTQFNISTIENHLLKDLWSEDWSSLYDDLIPYKDVPSGDIRDHLGAGNVSLSDLYHIADECFSSIGLTKAPLSVWANSIFERDARKKTNCLPYVFNLFEDGASAITTCGAATRSKASEAFRHMGQLQYFKRSAEQPIVFCRTLGTFLAEAVGGTVELSAMNPFSLHEAQRSTGDPTDKRIGLNYLLGVALQSLPRIAFHYSLNRWQRNLYSGSGLVPESAILWSRYRYMDRGISPSPELDGRAIFGPSHYLVYANEPAYPALFAEFLRFDLFSSLCGAANHVGPLHLCTIQGKPLIGAKLADLLSPGLSEPWMELLKRFNGANTVRADALLRFFQPLYKWLKRQNNEENECYGWGYSMSEKLSQPRCETYLPSQTGNYVAKLMHNFDLNMTSNMREMEMSWWSFANGGESLNAAIQSSLKAVADRQAWSGYLRKAYLPKQRNDLLTRAVKRARFVQMNLKSEDLAALLNITAQLSSVDCMIANRSYDEATPLAECSSREACNSIMATATDLELLKKIWIKWHDRNLNPFSQQLLAEGIALSNKGARNSGFDDITELWEEVYEMSNLEAQVKNRWVDVLPFYEQLHAFVRFNLQFIYADRFNISALPAHILGSLTGSSWSALFNQTAPCRECPMPKLDEALLRLDYTSRRIAETAEQFFQSLGMPPMTRLFWENSNFSQALPESYTSAWDMFEQDDYRIIAGSRVTWGNFVAIHGAMARVQYFMHYANRSIVFREALSPALYEAIEGFVKLSISSPSHLAALKLTGGSRVDSLNFLMQKALELLPQLALDHVTDLWKWKAFKNSMPRNKWNSEWWSLRRQYQGIVPPSPRAEGNFDLPNELTSWPLDMPSMHQFLGKLVQFQIFQHMCKISGHVGPLHLCNLYGKKVVGEKLADMLSLGSSVPWPKALMMVTGNHEVSAAPLLEYFKPLVLFLEENNNNKSNCYGWGLSWPLEVDATLPKPRCEEHVDWPFDPQQKEALRIKDFLRTHEIKMELAYQQSASAQWSYVVTKSDHHKALMMGALAKRAALENEQADAVKGFKLDCISDAQELRLLKRIAKPGLRFSKEGGELFVAALQNITRTYKSAFICEPERPLCEESANRTGRWYLKSELVDILASSNDTDLLEYVWTEWRRSVGLKVLPYFRELIGTLNAAANASGYGDAGVWLRSFYEGQEVEEVAEALWDSILPFYEILHAHVRGSLAKQFPNATKRFTIPAHLLGRMWANDWSNTLGVLGGPERSLTAEATERMIQRNYTALQMAREADEFFKSIGLAPMDDFFWNNSIFESYISHRGECQTAAMDFYNGKDFAISHCGRASLDDLATYHRLMAHVHYFMAYSKQPIKFREGANPAFHEAIAGAIDLSVTSVEHLRKLSLLDERGDSFGFSKHRSDITEAELSHLYAKALKIVPSLPHAYVSDLYRWRIMNGTIEINELNRAWWALKKKYQGIAPPVVPSDENFDAGSEYKVASNMPQMQHFLGQVMQFQIYQALCKQSGHVGPLHRCDISNSIKAGRNLYQTLSMGSSAPWQEALRLLTNSEAVSAKPMLDYFEPLITRLKWQTEQSDECYGWDIEQADIEGLLRPRCFDRKKNASGRGIASYVTMFLSCLLWVFATNAM